MAHCKHSRWPFIAASSGSTSTHPNDNRSVLPILSILGSHSQQQSQPHPNHNRSLSPILSILGGHSQQQEHKSHDQSQPFTLAHFASILGGHSQQPWSKSKQTSRNHFVVPILNTPGGRDLQQVSTLHPKLRRLPSCSQRYCKTCNRPFQAAYQQISSASPPSLKQIWAVSIVSTALSYEVLVDPP